MPVVTWLPGHGWRDGHWDSGAVSPSGWAEADLVRDVVAVAWRECERRHIPTEVASTGTYHQRGEDAEAGLGSTLIVQLHADAVAAEVGPDITRVFYWPESSRGGEAADKIARALDAVVPWDVAVYAADERWPGPRSCLAAVGKTASVLVELGFTDGARGRVELPHLVEKLGVALAVGVAV